MTEKIERLAELLKHTAKPPHPGAAAAGRTAFTRLVDAMFLWLRRYVPPVHWAGAWLAGIAMFLYAWLVAYTTQLVPVGARKWPDVPGPCVLVIWHGGAPSLVAAIARWRPRSPMAIMIATEPRGDSLTVLCRLLGFRVVRGDWEHHGWDAVERTAEIVAGGACALITPDGGGPRRVARPGALVLAAAAVAPLVAIGADCRPALREPHKWDRPRNPVPLGRIAISISEPFQIHDFRDAPAVESARHRLEQQLNEASGKARQALGISVEG